MKRMFKRHLPYTKATRQEGEIVVFSATRHWFRFALLHIITLFSFGTAIYWDNRFLAIPAALIFSFVLLDAFVTEIVITNRRFICKTGVMTTHITEFLVQNVDTIEIEQSLLGKIFGFATVIFKCEGVNLTQIPYINKPYKFHRILEASKNHPTPQLSRRVMKLRKGMKNTAPHPHHDHHTH